MIADIFDGEMKESIKCTNCNCISTPKNPFRYLRVEVPQRKSTLDECLQNVTKEEILKDKRCLTCHNSTEATKQTTFSKLPETLVIHLKRFSYQGKWMNKIYTPIDSPLQLDMSKYTEENERRRRRRRKLIFS